MCISLSYMGYGKCIDIVHFSIWDMGNALTLVARRNIALKCTAPCLWDYNMDFCFQEDMLHRLWSIIHVSRASPAIFGVAAVQTLLSELLPTPTGDSSRDARAQLTQDTMDTLRFPKELAVRDVIPGSTYVVTGYTGIDTLAKKIEAGKCHYPMAFALGLKLSGREDLAGDIASGLSDLHLNYFPNVKFWDSARHPSMNWDGKKVLRVIDPARATRDERVLMLSERLTADVKVNIHATGIVDKSRVETALQHVPVFPWMEKVILVMQYL
jgi:hypothetical protein